MKIENLENENLEKQSILLDAAKMFNLPHKMNLLVTKQFNGDT